MTYPSYKRGQRPALLFASSILLAPVGLALAAPSWAQTSIHQVLQVNVPAGALGPSLNEFAQQAGIAISFDARLVTGEKSQGLSGSMSVDEGIKRLLAGTGLQAILSNSGYRIERSHSTPIAINVEADELRSTTEGSGSYTTGSMNTATGLDLSIRETPQSVSVLSSQQIKDQNLKTLDDALRSINGLQVSKGELAGDSGEFSARGFEIDNITVDGMPNSVGGNGTFNADNADLAIYDRVEVVKGAAGLTTGSGNPSAAVNLVRKRPTATSEAAITASIGSWDDKRLMFDGSNALNADKSIRGRVVTSVQDKDNFYDGVNDNTEQLYGILEIDLSEKTMLTAGAHWRNLESDGLYTRLPVNSDGSFIDLPRSANYGNDFDYWDQQTKTVFAELQHQLDNYWQVTLSATHKQQDLDMLFSGLSGSEAAFYQNSQRYKMDRRQSNLALNANGPFSAFGREHELSLGVSHRSDKFDAYGGWSDYSWTTEAPLVDLYNWDSSIVPRPEIPLDLWTQSFETKQTGAFAAAKLSLSDPMNLIIGTRIDSYKMPSNREYEPDTQVTPYAGLVYDLDTNHSVYTSWTEIFQPQQVTDKNGTVLDPIVGTNIEAGLKGEYYGGKLNASLAVFQITQENRPVDDLSSQNPCPGARWGGYCKRPSGEVESNGVELELSGEVSPGWQVMAGYTYTSAEYSKDQDADNIGKPFDPTYPEHQFKFATTYHLSGDLSNWRLGANAYIQDGTYSSNDENIRQSGYAIFGANAHYEFSDDMYVQLNVNNLFDRHYYQDLGWTTGGTRPGEPRSWALSFNWQM